MVNERIIASTMTTRLFSYEGALKKLKSVGIERIELCPVKTWIPHFDALHATEASMDEMVKMANDVGVQIVTINGWHGLPRNGRPDAESIIRTENTMKLASKLGVKLVTGDAGEISEGEDRAERLRDVAAYQKLAADIAEDYGIQYCIEAPHKNTLAVHKENIISYWDAMDPRIKMAYDPAHLVFDNDDPLEILNLFVDRVGHVHMRDAIPGNSLLPYGEGQIDFAAIVEILNNAGYKGLFSMEFPVEDLSTFDKRMAESVEFLSKLDIR